MRRNVRSNLAHSRLIYLISLLSSLIPYLSSLSRIKKGCIYVEDTFALWKIFIKRFTNLPYFDIPLRLRLNGEGQSYIPGVFSASFSSTSTYRYSVAREILKELIISSMSLFLSL